MKSKRTLTLDDNVWVKKFESRKSGKSQENPQLAITDNPRATKQKEYGDYKLQHILNTNTRYKLLKLSLL